MVATMMMMMMMMRRRKIVVVALTNIPDNPLRRLGEFLLWFGVPGPLRHLERLLVVLVVAVLLLLLLAMVVVGVGAKEAVMSSSCPIIPLAVVIAIKTRNNRQTMWVS